MKKGKARSIIMLSKTDNTATSLNNLTDDITILSNDNANIQVTTEGQAIKIDSSQVSTNKTDIAKNTAKVGIPTGGTTGQSLVKKTDTDGDVEWKNGSGVDTVDNIVPVNGNVDLSDDPVILKMIKEKSSQMHFCGGGLEIYKDTLVDRKTEVDISDIIGKRSAGILVRVTFLDSQSGTFFNIKPKGESNWLGCNSASVGGNGCATGWPSKVDGYDYGVNFLYSQTDANGILVIEAAPGGRFEVDLLHYIVEVTPSNKEEKIAETDLWFFNPTLHNIYSYSYKKGQNYISDYHLDIAPSEDKDGKCQVVVGDKWVYKNDPYPEHRDYCKWISTGYKLDASKKDNLISVISDKVKSQTENNISTGLWLDEGEEVEFTSTYEHLRFTNISDAKSFIKLLKNKTMEELIDLLNTKEIVI